MKTSTKRVLAAAALMALTLCASAASARRGEVAGQRDGAHFYGLDELVPFEGINVERRDGEVVGMSVLRRDGSWLPLKQRTTPICATSCPAGQKLSCWEDEKELMCICVCVGGEPGRRPRVVIVGPADEF